jgi:hypothetical protein
LFITADSKIRGHVVFSKESVSYKTSYGATAIRAAIHHISAMDTSQRELILDMAIDYIMKNTKCESIRLKLYHYRESEEGQQKADPEMKNMLK